MFTGIIQSTVPIADILKKTNFRTHIVKMPTALLSELKLGSSVAHNGCCLTVTEIHGNLVSFDLMAETLRLTNLGMLEIGDFVNIECAASLCDKVSGHFMSGHIICTAKISKILISENNKTIWFYITDQDIMKYIFHKGYIGVDGISLTIGKVENNNFCVYFIPETLMHTTLGRRQLNDIVNIEIDLQTHAIVDTVERVLKTCEGIRATAAAASPFSQKQ